MSKKDIYKDFHVPLSTLRYAYKIGLASVHAGWTNNPMDTVRSEVEWFKREYVEEKLSQLKEELRVTDELLEERNRLLKVIPECENHGNQCVPHAIEWVKGKIK